VIDAGGLLIVLSGGAATHTRSGQYISGNAVVLEQAGGPAGLGSAVSNRMISAAQTLFVLSGGESFGVDVGSGAVEAVLGAEAVA
jgi:hypothetical protein